MVIDRLIESLSFKFNSKLKQRAQVIYHCTILLLAPYNCRLGVNILQ